MKLVDNVTILPVITTIPIPVERVMQKAIEAKPKYVMVIGEDAEGHLYFAASKSSGPDAVWWMEKAKLALLELTK